MRLLICFPISDKILTQVLAANVIYRPDLAVKDHRFLSHTLLTTAVDVIICQSLPTVDTIKLWQENNLGKNISIICIAKGVNTEISGVKIYYLDSRKDDNIFSALVLAEQLSNKNLLQAPSTVSKQSNVDVVLVGAGIVNLITAYYLLAAGYSVNLIEAANDPRKKSHWRTHGCTHGGENARMFSLTEADSYNDQCLPEDVSEFNNIFRKNVSEHGWDIRQTKDNEFLDLEWINDYEQLPTWLAKQYNQDILNFNAESKLLWADIQIKHPELFDEIGLSPDITRLYSDADSYQATHVRHTEIDSITQSFDIEQLVTKHPILSAVDAKNSIAGALETVGFTVNLHRFSHKLLNFMETQGLQCTWNETIEQIEYTDNGKVAKLHSNKREIVATNYVLSTGAYGNKLLVGTQSHNKIHGVLGTWLVIPNLAPKLKHSLKIVRKDHITEDANVTVAKNSQGEDVLILGSGYGYTGCDPDNIDQKQLRLMLAGVKNTVANYFPQAYETIKDHTLAEDECRYCIRPWTATSLGIFESIATQQQGALIITGGNNTGGFAQSPVIAQAVLAKLNNQPHAMHNLYHPQRLSNFMNTDN